MSKANKYGLRRSDLSSEQKRTIRKRSGFGCVVCGNAIYEYAHIDPPFETAKSHNIENITLLCNLCHTKFDKKGLLSLETVKSAMESPKPIDNGFSSETFDFGLSRPTIHIGPFTAENCVDILRIHDKSILRIDEPERKGAPYRVSAEFLDSSGDSIFKIVENELRTSSENWDVEYVGKAIKIRSDSRKVELLLRPDPPNAIRVEKMDMFVHGFQLKCLEDQFTIVEPLGRSTIVDKLIIRDTDVALDISNRGVSYVRHGGGMEITNMTIVGPPMEKRTRSRNAVCPCGSGKRYKHCCGTL